MIQFVAHGDFSKSRKYANKLRAFFFDNKIEALAQEGVAALASATPVDTGTTASSWNYDIDKRKDGITITWTNSNVVDGWCNVAVILQYGHGTRNGGYVSGRDYINPAIQPVMDKIAEAVWKEVKAL